MAHQVACWVLRSFKRRYVEFMRVVWKSLVQPLFNYGAQLWCQVTLLAYLEGTLSSFMRRFWGLRDFTQSESLRKFRMYSIQRKKERYRTIYIFKILMGHVPNLVLKIIYQSGGCAGFLLESSEISGKSKGTV